MNVPAHSVSELLISAHDFKVFKDVWWNVSVIHVHWNMVCMWYWCFELCYGELDNSVVVTMYGGAEAGYVNQIHIP